MLRVFTGRLFHPVMPKYLTLLLHDSHPGITALNRVMSPGPDFSVVE